MDGNEPTRPDRTPTGRDLAFLAGFLVGTGSGLALFVAGLRLYVLQTVGVLGVLVAACVLIAAGLVVAKAGGRTGRNAP